MSDVLPVTPLPEAPAPIRPLTPPAAVDAATRFLPILMVLFIGSGCAALIYEIVWFQLLELVIGSSAISIGVLLATFMGGMCLGSFFFSRIISSRFHPLRVYALLELAIGIIAVAVTLGMPAFDRLYIAVAVPGGSAILIRAIVCALCLLPPTILMGATLPAISRWLENTPRGASWLGFFYGGNTAGAVIGCLVAGFYLLRLYDMPTATYIAAGISVSVAVIGLLLSLITPHVSIDPAAPAPHPVQNAALAGGTIDPFGMVYIAIALSGMAALGAEVVWTRLLSLLLGGTTYTFSIILAVFLFGLGAGSSIGAMIARNGDKLSGPRTHARMALAWSQILCTLGIAWAAYSITQTLPFWGVDISLSINPAYTYQFNLARCLWAVLPPTLLWGASFPLALAAAIRPGRDPAKAVGRVYGANTVGAILGALLFSLVLIPSFGTQYSQRVLIAIAGVSAAFAVFPIIASAGQKWMRESPPLNPFPAVITLLTAIIVPAALITFMTINQKTVDEDFWKLIAWGRNTAINQSQIGTSKDNYSHDLYHGEGLNSSVAVIQTFEEGQTALNFHVSGKVEASTLPDDMRLQLMLGHFPALMHPNPEKVLIVGCGAGVTAGTFILHPEVKKIVICEIEPLIPQVVAKWFHEYNNGVVSVDDNGKLIDPRVEIVYDDARHYILTTHEKFDIITSDPIHPWVKGAATLYTKEYFDLVKAHLNPGGLCTQWVPLYESSEPVVKSEIGTFFKSFPGGAIFSNDFSGGYDIIVMGSNGDIKIDGDALQNRLSSHVLVAAALRDYGFRSATDILRTYGGRASDLTQWLSDADINYDRNLRLQYLAGENLNGNLAGAIYTHFLAYRKFPEGMITPTPDQRAALEKSWFPSAASKPQP